MGSGATIHRYPATFGRTALGVAIALGREVSERTAAEDTRRHTQRIAPLAQASTEARTRQGQGSSQKGCWRLLRHGWQPHQQKAHAPCPAHGACEEKPWRTTRTPAKCTRKGRSRTADQ